VHDILFQISVAILIATAFAFIANWLRQPVILGYIAAGIVVGSTEGFGWVETHAIEPISELGLILLLFMIGLEIDLKKLRRSGPAVLATGIGQFVICVLLGLAFFSWGRFDLSPGKFDAIYLAIAFSLSSTMIVVKLLYDKFELDSVPGRITLSILVFQDVWAILFLAVQPNLQSPSPVPLIVSLVKGLAIVALALLVTRYVLPVLFKSIAKLPELMVIGALAWCFGISLLAHQLNLSWEMGALIAGVAISTFPYNLNVVAKVISLRDFFITLFFVSLGTKIPRPTKELLLLSLIASVFLIASRFISITPILRFFRLGNRVSFIPALNLSQISEFSLVICALGVGLGHIGESVLSIVVYTLAITSVLSTYAILGNHAIFQKVNPLLKRIGLRDLDDEHPEDKKQLGKPIVFLGFSRYASSLLHELIERQPGIEKDIAVIDFNPQVKGELDRRGIFSIYGDVSHADVLHHANVHTAQVMLSTIPDSILKGTTNARLLRQLLAMGPEDNVVVTAEDFQAARELYREGAAFVFIPRLMSVRDLAVVVLAALAGKIDDVRQRAIAELEAREEVLP
jgi:Kef-type K+ transport system membrane component KefB/Trk K+ transport system NAD-binding subunit